MKCEQKECDDYVEGNTNNCYYFFNEPDKCERGSSTLTSKSDSGAKLACNDRAMPPFTEDDLDSCWEHHKSYLLEMLNGEYKLEDAIEDLRGLIGSEYDPRRKRL